MSKKIIGLLIGVGIATLASAQQPIDVSRVNILNAGDNIVTSTQGNNYHQLIGTYDGWDKKAIYIAGYNAGISNAYATERVFIGNPIVSNKYFGVDLMSGDISANGSLFLRKQVSINDGLMGLGVTDGTTSPKSWVNLGTNNHGSLLLSTNLFMSGDDNLFVAKDHLSMSGAAIIMPGNARPYQNGITFYTNTPGAVTAGSAYAGKLAMLIASDGNVCIGTDNAKGYKLAVNGAAIFTKAVVKNFNNWPDYVFDSSYQLPSLDSVSSFIQVNKHLPDMPSAAVVEKDGHDLGEVQRLLLKKMEEMTLYMIELKKENKILVNKVDAQQAEIELLKANKK